METLTIGLDLGTTTCKAAALSVRGEVCAVANRTYAVARPEPGAAEQSADLVWQAACAVLRDVMGQVDRSAVAGMSISGAMHSAMAVDAHDRALAPALTWSDDRPSIVMDELRADEASTGLYERTGCPLLPLYHPARLRWMKPRHAGAVRFVSIKDAVVHRLTGRWITDEAMASSSGLVDLRTRCWDAQALRLGCVTEVELPALVAPEAPVGALTGEAAAATGLPEGAPVIAGATDGALANLGAVGRSERTVVTIGTSAAIRRFVRVPTLDPRKRSWCYIATHGMYLAGCAMTNGGNVLERFSDAMAFDRLLARIEDGTHEVDANDLVVVPFERPERGTPFSPRIRPVHHGFTQKTAESALIRATAEGVAMAAAIAMRLVDHIDIPGEPVRFTGGWARTPQLAQLVADVLQRPLEVGASADASVLGAAMLAQDAMRLSRESASPVLQRVEPDRARADAIRRRLDIFARYTSGSHDPL